jgi:hypothetical protein
VYKRRCVAPKRPRLGMYNKNVCGVDRKKVKENKTGEK